MEFKDLALLIKAHEFRNTDFESAVYDVIDKGVDWSEGMKAHVYATVVENCQPHTPHQIIQEVMEEAYRKGVR